MTCDEIRIALSARLDGEDPQAPAARLDGHLAGCAACRVWLARAEQVTRAVRVQPAEVPDLTAAVLAAVAADPRGPAAARRRAAAAARGRRQILRVAVAVAAVAQLAVALPILLAGFGVAVDPHTSREMASFDVALAVGFALAAYRPERAQAFVPVAFVLAVCLAGTSAVDIANSTTLLVHEIGHLAAVVQAVLLWALGRVSGGRAGPVSTAAAAGRG
ncbi:Predicted anti-sigma-YlaC factor YlaD, contains Zn-finger domain [Micromonospora pattaloongensis]|uniref:Predicted anti-sigma-YlaC factor YlaD, contains Zn-finger domain n=1 Tax=Micromonospora pattaloongensis TaxID=405436 RepID=A0A1H3FSI7_9ACTN|nr:zf-HC2 domain-containing protein [Micromonospora pattaloongensis]SDX93089.1 Predicted anti-sigma-YlaC factor YlaD, contains Zn-finger domain [Micromonospora pattaloongensis]